MRNERPSAILALIFMPGWAWYGTWIAIDGMVDWGGRGGRTGEAKSGGRRGEGKGRRNNRNSGQVEPASGVTDQPKC